MSPGEDPRMPEDPAPQTQEDLEGRAGRLQAAARWLSDPLDLGVAWPPSVALRPSRGAWLYSLIVLALRVWVLWLLYELIWYADQIRTLLLHGE